MEKSLFLEKRQADIWSNCLCRLGVGKREEEPCACCVCWGRARRNIVLCNFENQRCERLTSSDTATTHVRISMQTRRHSNECYCFDIQLCSDREPARDLLDPCFTNFSSCLGFCFLARPVPAIQFGFDPVSSRLSLTLLDPVLGLDGAAFSVVLPNNKTKSKKIIEIKNKSIELFLFLFFFRHLFCFVFVHDFFFPLFYVTRFNWIGSEEMQRALISSTE